VRTRAVVPGRWVLAALGGALALAGIVFVLLPAWLAPAPTPAPRADEAPAPRTTAPAAAPADAAETVRQRLLATEAAARYRADADALRERGAAAWAADAFARADGVAKAAEAALAGGDFARAEERYRDAGRLLAEIGAGAEAAFDRALADGEAALADGAGAKAAEAFRLALLIRPDDARARRGLGRAEKMDDVRDRVATGEALERDGRLTESREAYAAAATLDPEHEPARAALKRLDGRLASQRFDALMTDGLARLERSDWAGAERSFSAALQLRAGSAPAADALARARAGLQREQLASLQAEGRGHESAERWEDALATYRRAAGIDPTVVFATEGIARSERRIALHARIAAFLADPQRLYSPRVRDEAQQLLAELGSESAAGPRLAAERDRLGAAVRRAAAEVTLQLASDNATDVVLYRVGPLGRFHAREVTLTPGTYTLVGSRPGFRDVRVEVTLEPGQPAPRVFIACEERV
jgi:hypothetical protein